uniref:GP2b' protein n=1 Tax=Free State vervet virus TaxID=1737586 RepID=A0A159D6V6_9NIDO|nr:GP2b' protein [Free State vervet virus]
MRRMGTSTTPTGIAHAIATEMAHLSLKLLLVTLLHLLVMLSSFMVSWSMRSASKLPQCYSISNWNNQAQHSTSQETKLPLGFNLIPCHGIKLASTCGFIMLPPSVCVLHQ